MEMIGKLVELFLSWFGTLEPPLKLVVIAGLAMPVLAFYSYLRPAPPPPLPPPDGKVILPDGKVGKLYIEGDAYVIKKSKR